MDYIYYVLAALAIGFLCLSAIRHSSKNENSRVMLEYASRRIQQTAAITKTLAINPDSHSPVKSAGAQGDSHITSRHAHRVQTQRRWSSHQKHDGFAAQPVASTRMQSFMNRLVRQKELVSSSSNMARAHDSVRSLLGDRHSPIRRESMNVIEYKKVKRPLLRDPSELYDQMDDFDSREAERIRVKIMHVVSMNSEMGSAPKKREFRYVDIKDVKQPWGW